MISRINFNTLKMHYNLLLLLNVHIMWLLLLNVHIMWLSMH